METLTLTRIHVIIFKLFFEPSIKKHFGHFENNTIYLIRRVYLQRHYYIIIMCKKKKKKTTKRIPFRTVFEITIVADHIVAT